MELFKGVKEDIERTKGYSFRQKLDFIREYYKLPIIIVLAVIGIILSFIMTNHNQKEPVLTGILLNADPREEAAVSALEERFLNELQMDPKDFEVTINSGLTYAPEDNSQFEANYTTMEVLSAQAASGQLDFLAGNEKIMITLAYSDFLVDLSQVLTAEQLDKHADRLLYVDLAVLEAFQKAADSGDYSADIQIPDPSMPEKMEKPIPVLLILDECKDIKAVYNHTTEKVLFGVIANYPHQQSLLRFLDFLFS